MNIVEFLEARIAEDEQVARDATEGPWVGGIRRAGEPGRWRLKVESYTVLAERDLWIENHEVVADTRRREDREHITRHEPARVLAECAAKRALINKAENWAAYVSNTAEDNRPSLRYDAVLTSLLGPLAAIYAAHPDYREEWRLAKHVD